MQLKTIIIDDQPEFVEMLCDVIVSAQLPLQIVSKAGNANDGFMAIRKLHPDVVFLDVEMPGKSGIELAKEFTDRNFEIVFTTSHDKYAVQAFKTDAVDYLMKPVDVVELTKAVDRVIARRNEKLLQSKIGSPEQKKITVSTMDGVLFVEIGKIMRLEADNVYTTIYTTDANKIVASKALKDFEDRLANSGFIRVHRSHLINLTFVKKLYKGDNAYLVMQDESVIPVSKSGRDELQKHFDVL